jgi:membrane protein involved in colicin uptake
MGGLKLSQLQKFIKGPRLCAAAAAAARVLPIFDSWTTAVLENLRQQLISFAKIKINNLKISCMDSLIY